MSDLIRSLICASAVWGRHLCSLFLLLIAPVVWAAEPTRTPSSEGEDAPILGWRPGTPAAGTAAALAPVDPIPMAIPDRVAQRVEGETAVYYFSPTCGHCRAAMPDITALQGKGDIQWLGIAVSSATPEEIEEFRATFAVEFPIITDVDRQFARAVGARSTPSVYVMRPMPAATAESADESTDESGDDHAGHDHAGHDHSGHGHGPITHPLLQMGSPPGHAEVLMTQAYPPFVRGAGPVLLMRSHLDQPFADFSGYQGDVVCRGCHEQEALSMAISHHAVALYTLYQREEHDNPECVSCHVTGMGEPGGYVMGDLSHPLADVQCEACHGPSGPHDGVATDARSQCVGCHDEKHSVAFSVEKGLPFIDHYAANGLSDAQLRERLEALAAGTADKPLLAFPEGPSVGVATCRSCHSDIHASWKKSPHGRAMKSLRKDDKRGDPECVSCHATQKAYGPGVPTTEVAHFRTDESVGCESCHGPGAVHASEPRKDNIVGLSGSCPECVIEAICTSCHTPEWDPEWNLSERLEALDHHAADDAP